jgi:hypothetical protein
VTIICIKDGVMAADSGVFGDDILLCFHKKIVRGPKGSLAGAAGPHDLISQFQDWIIGGEIGPLRIDAEETEFGGLILRPGGAIFAVTHKSRILEILGGIAAEGIGRSFAMGAMLSGASAEQAAQLCVERVARCGGEVQVERLEPVDENIADLADHHVLDDPDVQSWRQRKGLA